jgi:hypothetical protein
MTHVKLPKLVQQHSQPCDPPLQIYILVAYVTLCPLHNRAEQPLSLRRVCNLDQPFLYLLHVHGQVPLAPVPDLQTAGAPRRGTGNIPIWFSSCSHFKLVLCAIPTLYTLRITFSAVLRILRQPF